ncbi:MAG: acetate--CoA ligase family protein [Nitrospinae bacterium]|nr:acetate--CoA ligase family protein [Nitrospinota bacterium]
MMNKQDMVKIIKKAMSANRKSLSEPETKALISAWGIPVPKTALIKKQEEIAAATKNLNPPFVLKVVSPDILHKSEIGGVKTELKDAEEINKAWAKMIIDIKDKSPKHRIDGFLLEEMAPKGVEVIIGALRDPQFGPAVMFGIGGIAVELMKDVSYRLAPINKKYALDMIREVKSYPLLTGFRGSKPVDLENIASVIIKLSEILIKIEDIKEIEINPLIVYEKGVMAVDARVVLNSI